MERRGGRIVRRYERRGVARLQQNSLRKASLRKAKRQHKNSS
jgi:hypothetical protein